MISISIMVSIINLTYFLTFLTIIISININII